MRRLRALPPGETDTMRARARPDPRILIPEEYAHVHADIEAANPNGNCLVVGVTSATFGEGKTTVAINLAGTIARNSEARVALVDGNLRNWDLQMRLNMSAAAGIVDLLEGTEQDLPSIVRGTELDNLVVLPSGRAAVNPARMIRSKALDALFKQIRDSSDYVIVDLAPVLPIADTKTMMRLVDGFVLVVQAGKTPRAVVKRAMDTLGKDKILGIVLNGAETNVPGWLQRFLVG